MPQQFYVVAKQRIEDSGPKITILDHQSFDSQELKCPNSQS